MLFMLDRLEALLPADTWQQLVVRVTHGEKAPLDGILFWRQELVRPLEQTVSLRAKEAEKMVRPQVVEEVDHLRRLMAELDSGAGIGDALRAAEAIGDKAVRCMALAQAALALVKAGDSERANALLPFATDAPVLAWKSFEFEESMAAVIAAHVLQGREDEAAAVLSRLPDHEYEMAGCAALRDIVAAGEVERAVSLAARFRSEEDRFAANRAIFGLVAENGQLAEALQIARDLFRQPALDQVLYAAVRKKPTAGGPPSNPLLATAIANPMLRHAALRHLSETLAGYERPGEALNVALVMEHAPDRVGALIAVGTGFARARETPRATEAWNLAATEAEALPDAWHAACLLGVLGTVTVQAGLQALGITFLERAAARAEAIASNWRRSACMHELAVRLSAAGSDEHARQLIDLSILADYMDADD